MLARLIASIAFVASALLIVPAPAAVVTALVLLAASEAQAACSPVAGAGPVPAPGTTVTCTGATSNQNPPDGYGTGIQTGLTVDVQTGASVQGSRFGIYLDSGNTINNSGTVSGGAPGIFLGASNTVNNSGTISGPLGIQTGAGSTVTNSGTITGTSSPAPAVQFLNGGATLILHPTSVLNGGAAASTTITTDALQLGGSGSGSFNVSQIGSTPGYRGFDTFAKVGDSTWTLTGTGAQNWTITQGTLVGNTSSLQGQITNNAALVFDQATNGTFANVISGTGTLTKQNSGTLTFTGTNTYTGGTTISAGTLLVNGSIALSSGVTVNAGGTVGGTGTLPSTTISGGTLAPGNSIGTVTVQGDLGFSPSSTYLVEISPTAADRTNVTGTATLAGTVHVVPEAGSYARGTTYTILNATGGRTGTFSGLTIASAFLCACLSYDANNVYLTITPKNFTFADAGQTPNQIATGAAVERLGTGSPIYDVVVLGTAEQARAAFDLLSGEIHASLPGLILYDSHYVRDAIIGRLRQSYGSNGGLLTALAANGPVVTYAHADTNRYALGVGDPQHPTRRTDAAPVHDGLAAWGQALGAWGDLDSDGNAATLQRSLGGIITGLDATFDLWRLGLAAGYTQSSLDVDARLSSGSIDAYHLALYGGGQFGAVGVRTGTAYSWNDMETSRSIAFSGGEGCCASFFSDTVKAGYNARTVQVFGDLGYSTIIDGSAFEPFAGIAYVDLQSDAFTETGGAAALTAERQSFDATFTTLGLRAATVLALTDGTDMTVHGTLGWRHAFGDVTPEMALAFATNSVPFIIGGVPIAEDSLVIDAGLGFDVTANAKLSISYSGQLATDAQDQAVLGNLLVQF